MTDMIRPEGLDDATWRRWQFEKEMDERSAPYWQEQQKQRRYKAWQEAKRIYFLHKEEFER